MKAEGIMTIVESLSGSDIVSVVIKAKGDDNKIITLSISEEELSPRQLRPPKEAA